VNKLMNTLSLKFSFYLKRVIPSTTEDIIDTTYYQDLHKASTSFTIWNV
jgi:hypothetical protein